MWNSTRSFARRAPSAPVPSEEHLGRLACSSASPALPESSLPEESPPEESPHDDEEESLVSKSLKGGVNRASPRMKAACLRFFMNIVLALKLSAKVKYMSQVLCRFPTFQATGVCLVIGIIGQQLFSASGFCRLPSCGQSGAEANDGHAGRPCSNISSADCTRRARGTAPRGHSLLLRSTPEWTTHSQLPDANLCK